MYPSRQEKRDRFSSGDKIKREIPDVQSTEKPDELEAQVQDEKLTVSEFRTVLPQILATSIINLTLLDLGMVLAFPTIIIPDMLKSTESLRFTEEQASWFGSVAFLCQPLGSLFSGFLFDPVGRKKPLFFVNIPLTVGWLLIHFCTTLDFLYLGAVIMDIGIGFLSAPPIMYLGEIIQPKWRGVLTSYAELCVALGFCFVYFMGTTFKWKTVSTICSAVPVMTMVLITQIPESPIWLLSKGREKEAERSLCWLRGWVKPHVVREEFADLKRHNNEIYKIEENCRTDTIELKRNHKSNICKKCFYKMDLNSIFRKSVLQPLFLVVVYFGFSHAAGVTPTRPFMIDILAEFGTPLHAKWVMAITSVIGILGSITGMILLPRIGKRLLSLISIFGCTAICSVMSIYGFFFVHLNIPLILVSLFVVLNFIWSAGIGQIPWMLISEVFPFKGRGYASGISAALSYIWAFVFTKTYYVTYNSLSLPGVFAFYAGCTFFGGLFLCYYLPETEGKTLEQIESIVENHFNKSKKGEKKINQDMI